MNKKIIWGVVIAVVVLAGIYYFIANTPKANVSTGDTNTIPTTALSPEAQNDLKYLPGWTAHEADHNGADGNIDYKGYVLVPPAPHADVISIGAHRISVCADIPSATKCFGGGKGSDSTVTFTTSNDPFVLSAFDSLQSKTSSKTYKDPFGFSFTYPSTWNITKKDNVISITTDTSSSGKITITEISGPKVSDSTGKWGEVSYYYQDGKLIGTGQSERDASLYTQEIKPTQFTIGGFPILSGAIKGHGFGEYSYMVALSPIKWLIITGTEPTEESGFYNNPLTALVHTITK